MQVSLHTFKAQQGSGLRLVEKEREEAIAVTSRKLP